jgi:HD-GYP domain-containing protein (c-di-GMP phosphodiesterase class II)
MATAAARPKQVPARIRLYVAGVATLAVALLPLTLLSHGLASGWAVIIDTALLTALIAWASRHPVQIGPNRKMAVGAAPQVAALLLLPGPITIFAQLVAGLAFRSRRPRPVELIFNTSHFALQTELGVIAFALLGRLRPAVVAEPVAVLAALVALIASDALAMAGILGLQFRENPWRRSWTSLKDTFVANAVLGLTGVMAALATADHAWALPLLVAPAAIAYYALRDGVALRVQTRLALEDLADIVDMRDHYTFEHSRRVAELARLTARTLELPHAEIELITMAGRVHDVGKIGVKSTVLMKPGGLTDREWGEMRSHPEVGARLIGNFPQFAKGREYVLHHHERFDGKGYPGGLAGEQIPLGARVLAVADAWDAMTSHRAYRRALELGVDLVQLEQGRGKQFDPVVLDAFLLALRLRPDLAVIHHETSQDVDEAPPDLRAAS